MDLLPILYGILDVSITLRRWYNNKNIRKEYVLRLDHYIRIEYYIEVFLARFFYYAKPKDRNKENNCWQNIQWFISNRYELFWKKVPFPGEIIIKAIPIVSILTYYYKFAN
jgi:hypothetical protein